MPDLAAFGHTLSVWFLPVILAITMHEAAHAWAAWKLGDDTAKSLGRLSFNPVRHVDPFGTLILPGMLLVVGAPFLFGWAKPVPVAFHKLHHPKRDMIWVALAGPAHQHRCWLWSRRSCCISWSARKATSATGSGRISTTRS